MSIEMAYKYPDFPTWYKDNQNYDDEFIKDDPTNYNFTHKLDIILTKTHGYVAGGCFKNMVKGEDPKDIDIYYEDKMDMEESIKRVDDDFHECPQLREPEEWMLNNQEAFTTAWMMDNWDTGATDDGE